MVRTLRAILVLAVAMGLLACPSSERVDERPNELALEELQISEALRAHIKRREPLTYVLYTFSGEEPYKEPHRQYWQGILVLDEMDREKSERDTADAHGSVDYGWQPMPPRKSTFADTVSKAGLVVKRQSMNPDGSSQIAVDLTQDGVVDYLDVLLPDGQNSILASDPHGLAFLDELLGGKNPYCQFSEIFQATPEALYGCEEESGEDDSDGQGSDSDGTASENPLDDLMEDLCAGFGSNNTSGPRVGTHTYEGFRDLPNGDWQIISARQYDRDGQNVKVIRTTTFTSDNELLGTEIETIVTDAEGNVTETHVQQLGPDGAVVLNTHTTYNDDGTITRTTQFDDGSSTWSTEDAEGNVINEGFSPADTHPGWDPMFDGGMAEFCAIWDASQNDRPNDVDQLNERANEERCSVAPNESDDDGEDDDSSLAKTCFLDVDGRIEVDRILAAGVCVSRVGGTHFDYQTAEQCESNYARVLDEGILNFGGAGVTGFECDQLVCRGPED